MQLVVAVGFLAAATALIVVATVQLGNASGGQLRTSSLETLRAYVSGLGGHLDIVARIGNIHPNVA